MSIESRSPQLPRGTKRVVIFDTNAYRDFIGRLPPAEARAKALRLRLKEQTAGVLALANPFVIWELAAHLAEPADESYDKCLSALTALSEHTWNRNDPPGGVVVIADPETTVCRELFRKNPPAAAQNVQNLCLLAAHIKNNPPPITYPPMLHNLRVFADKMNAMEKHWLEDMQGVLDGCAPEIAKNWVGGETDKETRSKLKAFFTSEAFMIAWAGVMVMRHAALVDAEIVPDKIQSMVQAMRDIFPAPFYLMSAFLQKFPEPNPLQLDNPKKKRGNYVWDTAICFTIGKTHEIENAKMYLVTGDGPIIDAARAAKCEDRVLSLRDYLTSLEG